MLREITSSEIKSINQQFDKLEDSCKKCIRLTYEYKFLKIGVGVALAINLPKFKNTYNNMSVSDYGKLWATHYRWTLKFKIRKDGITPKKLKRRRLGLKSQHVKYLINET